MSRRPTPLEQMRQLADDGMEAWQIAAALGVRESAVLTALDSPAPAGGAVRAVEDAVSLVPAGPAAQDQTPAPHAGMAYMPEPSEPVEKPATPAYGTPESAARGRALVEELHARINALGLTSAHLRDWAADRNIPCPPRGLVPARVVDAWEAEHAVRLERLAGGMVRPAAEQPTAGDPAEAARRARDEHADREEHGDCVGCVADGTHPADVTPAAHAGEGPGLPQSALLTTHPDGPDPSGALIDVEPEHVHDPFVAFTEAGIPYATCECGQTWERQTCEACPAIVTALHVATFGPIHKHCAAKRATTERTNP